MAPVNVKTGSFETRDDNERTPTSTTTGVASPDRERRELSSETIPDATTSLPVCARVFKVRHSRPQIVLKLHERQADGAASRSVTTGPSPTSCMMVETAGVIGGT